MEGNKLNFESSQESTPEEREEQATLNLLSLGLTWEDLQDKLVLDVGAGIAEITEVGIRKNIKIIPIDKDPAMWVETGKKIPNIPYVVADSVRLPFSSNAFDLIISHGGPPMVLNEKEKIIGTIKEFERVLKENGEARFGFSAFDMEVLGEKKYEDGHEEPIQKFRERVQKSLAFLKSINSNIEVEKTSKKSKSGMVCIENYFYILKK